MKIKLKEHFLTVEYEQTLYIKMTRLKQDNKSVEKYKEEFVDVTIFNKISETKAQKAARYRKRLRLDIKSG